MTAGYKMTLPAIELENAVGQAKVTLEKAKELVGSIPNMYAVMVNYPELLETYLDGYRRFRKTSNFDAIEQEVVFLVISAANGCEYCVAAHSMIAGRSKVPAESVQAIRSGNKIADAKLSALAVFVRLMTESRGMPTNANVKDFLAAGYTERHILEIVLAISVKVISNYSNHLFHTPVDAPFAGHAWKRPPSQK
jgi:AhpD family alkylhydroperoxidase